MSLTPREHDALRESAHLQRVLIAKAAAQIIRGHLTPGQDARPAPLETVAPEPLPTLEKLSGPAWLPARGKSAYQEWVQNCAAAVQALLDRYPVELAALSDGWARDAAVREQLWALSVWRDHLDIGLHDDPRMELAFANSLSDFAIYLQGRNRVGRRRA